MKRKYQVPYQIFAEDRIANFDILTHGDYIFIYEIYFKARVLARNPCFDHKRRDKLEIMVNENVSIMNDFDKYTVECLVPGDILHPFYRIASSLMCCLWNVMMKDEVDSKVPFAVGRVNS